MEEQKKYRRGLVAISGDPITYGHLGLIEAALGLCREVVLLIAINDDKKYLFEDLAVRFQMSERAVREAGLRDVTVVCSRGLLVDVYLREGCDVVVRGARNPLDLNYEEELALANKLILSNVEVELIRTDPDHRIISSSLAKVFVRRYADEVRTMVPPFVKEMLEVKLLGQRRLAVTGGMAVGKSHVAEEIVRQIEASGRKAKLINVDELIRQLYREDSVGAQLVREAVEHICGEGVLTSDRKNVLTKVVAARIFQNDPQAAAKRLELEELTKPYVASLYRAAMEGFKDGLVVLEWAELAEMAMGHWTNGHAVVVDSPDRADFARSRGISEERLMVTDAIQWSFERKFATLQERARKEHQGVVLPFQNRLFRTAAAFEANVEALIDRLEAAGVIV